MTFDETTAADFYFGAMKVQVICHLWHLRWKDCDLKLLPIFHHRTFETFYYHQKILSYLNITFSEAKQHTYITLFASRVGNFRKKNNSAEDGNRRKNGYLRRNSGCSAEHKPSEFRSEPFRGRESNSEFRSVGQK
jgi:hypothetical protein